ncbi:MAG TPA: hypothetical protein VK256_06545 [Candidatus Eisenbacteria bacterium]|nr:hypothetical protein [Candidatus Eisenbacteria bacterium]
MKRIFLGLSVAVGTLLMGLTNASAGTFCSDDPVLPVGTPLTYSITVKVPGTTTVVYAYGAPKTTTFGFVLGT